MEISPGGRPINTTSLDRSPKKNWVEAKGGLPPYIRGVARGIARRHGGTVTSRDIAMAIAAIKRWAKGGDNVSPAVQAAAAAALALWTAMKGGDSKPDLSNSTSDVDLSIVEVKEHLAKGLVRAAEEGT